MTAKIIRRQVSLTTGEIITREETGETAEIAENEYLTAMSIVQTGMMPDVLCEEIKKRQNII